MKLQQNQVWKQGDHFLRIVHLERLAVGYKVLEDLTRKEGSHHQVSKKEFCRLIKGAQLLTPADLKALATATPAAPASTGSDVAAADEDSLTGTAPAEEAIPSGDTV